MSSLVLIRLKSLLQAANACEDETLLECFHLINRRCATICGTITVLPIGNGISACRKYKI